MRVLIASLLGCCALAAAAPARAQDTTLDRVQNLAATGRFTDARTTLASWERQHADPRSSASAADRARATYLRGTLSTDAKEAEEAYLAVVLSHPSSEVAPLALLRLGQGLVTSGDARRAVAYLERLRTDYPGSAAREQGWPWLIRAQIAAGSTAAACASARDGLAATRDVNVRTLIELEQDRACGATPAATPDAQNSTPARAAPPRTAAEPPPTRYAVQLGAFRDRASAERTAAGITAKGFDARVVITEGSVLFRVRSGTFTSAEQAAQTARRLRDAGFTTLIVSDVSLERRE